ncbi:MAG TPA: hypothetical protein VEY09_03415 [Pyrinomonadaceae bacterium]|nr:hypothetical protein [Pyrinomonadaceae bacterium]
MSGRERDGSTGRRGEDELRAEREGLEREGLEREGADLRDADESSRNVPDGSRNARGTRPHVEAPPPFGGSWRRLYAAVLLNLALMIVLFYLFMRAFS